MTSRLRVAVAVKPSVAATVFDGAARVALASFADVAWADREDIQGPYAARLASGARALVTGWGSPPVDAALLDAAPELGLLAHSAGSVKPFVSDALWARGITVTSAAAAIAPDVAQAALALMILSVKRAWLYARHTRSGGWRGGHCPPPDDLSFSTVGVIGAGHVGRHLLKLLAGCEVTALLYDPYVSEADAAALGARKTGLDELLRASDVVSLHAPSTPETHHMLSGERLRLLKDGAVLVNTARGALVDEAALIEELRAGRLFACLDVTDPEPPAPDSPLRQLDNVVLTPHLSGSAGRGRFRLGRFVVEEIRRFADGRPPLHPVTREMLARMA